MQISHPGVQSSNPTTIKLQPRLLAPQSRLFKNLHCLTQNMQQQVIHAPGRCGDELAQFNTDAADSKILFHCVLHIMHDACRCKTPG